MANIKVVTVDNLGDEFELDDVSKKIKLSGVPITVDSTDALRALSPIAKTSPVQTKTIDGVQYAWDEASTDADNGATVIKPSATTGAGRYILQYTGAAKASWFGFTPDDGSSTPFDNTPLWGKLCDWINARGGNFSFEFEAGKTYRFGQGRRSTDTSAYGKGYLGFFEDVDSVFIYGNGATVKAMDGIHFGLFNADGTAMADYTNMDDDCSWGNFIEAEGTLTNFHVADLEIDGNVDNYILGGKVGDNGWQVPCHGMRLRATLQQCSFENMYIHHMGTDGIEINTYHDIDTIDDAKFSNVVSNYNGRQGISLTGAVGIIFENCEFSYTGKNTKVASNPMAGVDLESEDDTPVQDNIFVNCIMAHNGNSGIVTAAWDGHVRNKFIDCTIQVDKDDETALYITAPRSDEDIAPCIFDGCYIYGYARLGACDYLNCQFTDIPNNVYPSVKARNNLYEGTDTNVRIEGCNFNIKYSAVSLINAHNCVISMNHNNADAAIIPENVLENGVLDFAEGDKTIASGNNTIFDNQVGVPFPLANMDMLTEFTGNVYPSTLVTAGVSQIIPKSESGSSGSIKTTVDFEEGWLAYSGSYNKSQHVTVSRDGNIITLAGFVRKRADEGNDTICYLPEEYRPNRHVVMYGLKGNTAIRRVDVFQNGRVQCIDITQSNAVGWLSLDMSFIQNAL